MPDGHSQTITMEYSGERIPVALEMGNRKRLTISVHPDKSVTAAAPADRSVADVIRHLERRKSWIVRQRRHFEKYQPLPLAKRYVSGETHLYLGRQYRLRIRQSRKPSVKLKGRFIQVRVQDPSNPRIVRKALDDWYRQHAADVFARHIAKCAQVLETRGVSEPRYKLRRMSRRWASCTASGIILINPDLVRVPVCCIDYVLVHELCHLIEPNHGPRFQRLLARCLPDWQARKARLDAVVLA